MLGGLDKIVSVNDHTVGLRVAAQFYFHCPAGVH